MPDDPDNADLVVQRMIGPILNIQVAAGAGVPILRAMVEGLVLPLARARVAELERWLHDNPPSEVDQWSLGG